jgi:outer membrane protein assembly factor BamB
MFMAVTLTGDVFWEQILGGEGYEQAWAVAPAEDDGFYIFGETDSYGAGDRDFFLLKTDQDGNEDWYRTYGGPLREWPFGMLTLSNGDMLIYGFTEAESRGERNQYAVRVDPSGDVVWEYIDESSEEELVADAIETKEGHIVLAVIVEEDGKLVKLDADGSLLWATRYELPGWQFASQIERTDDGFLLAGFSMSEGSRRQADTWLAHCTSTGELDWEKSFGEQAYDDYAQSLLRLKNGDYLIGGLGNGMPFSRIDADGNILWSRSLVGEAVHGAEALIELDDGGFLVAGFVQLVNGRSYDAILLRTDGEGLVREK